ncbi:MAG: hypothetical protein IPK82_24070 [Polyangiaceae bacterium]|nr:hypothetical protein [Polyangiaceae bacterium]
MDYVALATFFLASWIVLGAGFAGLYFTLTATSKSTTRQYEEASHNLSIQLDAITDKQASVQGTLEVMRTQSAKQQETLERLTTQLEGPQSMRRPR